MERIEYSIRGRKRGIMANTGHLVFGINQDMTLATVDFLTSIIATNPSTQRVPGSVVLLDCESIMATEGVR